MRHRILVVDDEESFVSSLTYVLDREGFDVTVARDGEEAVAKALASQPDLILLDLMLPGIPGLEVCKMIRRELDTAIIMLTARDGDLDTMVGLDTGADDYITKPFNLGVLLARIRAVLRRRQPQDTTQVRSGPLSLDPESYSARWHDNHIDLTPRLFQLLMYFASNPGRVLTRDDILNKVWGYEFAGETRTVDVHVHWLRESLSRAGAGQLIETLRGVGYRMVVPL